MGGSRGNERERERERNGREDRGEMRGRGRDSAGLRSVEAPGQQCYRKVVDVLIIST